MKDVIVIGNGRSLKEYDFKKIPRDKYDIICTGLSYRYWEKIDWWPDIYINIDNRVCMLNKSVSSFIKKKKCKKYITSNTILNVSPEFKDDESISFFQDIILDESRIYKNIKTYGSGTISVYYALENYDNVNMIGFDCDYVEYLPETDYLVKDIDNLSRNETIKYIEKYTEHKCADKYKISEEELKNVIRNIKIIKKTPKYNPNYFFDSYQQVGDIYSKPKCKPIHYKSWIELSKKIPENKKLINYNDKKTLYKFFESKPLKDISFTEYNKPNKVAFCVPSTTNKRDWINLQETYLYGILLESIRPLQKLYEISVYIGYDHDDKLYSQIDLPEYFNRIKLIWIPFKDSKGNPCNIWNKLSKRAINDGHEYIQIGGDDIQYDKRSEWLPLFIKKLKKNNNIGYSSGYSNNNSIPTQFLFHKKHLEYFDWIYPPQIKNWQCDDFIYHLYGEKYGNWLKQYNHYNIGGEPRYDPDNCVKLREKLVDRYKKVLYNKLKK